MAGSDLNISLFSYVLSFFELLTNIGRYELIDLPISLQVDGRGSKGALDGEGALEPESTCEFFMDLHNVIHFVANRQFYKF